MGNGKGSARRGGPGDARRYERGWERVFGRRPRMKENKALQTGTLGIGSEHTRKENAMSLTATSPEYLIAAREIQAQIGPRALYMLGAKNLGASQNADGKPVLFFKIGRNAKGVTHVRITLRNDLYDMAFLAIRGTSYHRVVSELEGVYNDMLHTVLESHTGMRTHL